MVGVKFVEKSITFITPEWTRTMISGNHFCITVYTISLNRYVYGVFHWSFIYKFIYFIKYI